MENFANSRRFGQSGTGTGTAAFVPPVILPQTDVNGPAAGSGNFTGGFTRVDLATLSAAKVTMPQKYGETILVNNVLGLSLNLLVLQQPATTRVFLLIQNNHATADLWVNYGQPAALNQGEKIVAGGNILLDAFVPQDEVNLFSVAAVPFAVHYANKALT